MDETKTIQSMPESERPYERCLRYGPGTLSDSELLAVILRSGTRGRSSVELAREVLKLGNPEEGLLGIHHRSLQELMQIRGIGEVKAVQIKCIGELSKRMAAGSAKEFLDFHNPETIAGYYMEQMRHEEQEKVVCLMLNTRSCLIGQEILAKGTVNSALISPREVLLAVLRHRAVYVILIHNHPSGNPQPSKADIEMTRQVQEACTIVDIPLLDHIVIGDQRYVSFRADGILPF